MMNHSLEKLAFLVPFLCLGLLGIPSATAGDFQTSSLATSNRTAPDKEKPIVILSVDGGGVRGLIPAVLIAEMEKQLGKPITEMVDLFAGTSAGSIVIGFLNIPNAQKKQRYTAVEAVDLSQGVITKLFSNSVFRKIRTLGGLAGSKYSAKPLEGFLNQYLGDLTVANTVKPILIPSIDLKTNQIFNFSTRYAKEWPAMFNLPMQMAIRASTAAPVYFKPIGVRLRSGADLVLADGGIIALSPDLLALVEARILYPNRHYILISLSTGRFQGERKIAATGINGGSALKMIEPFIGASLSGQLSLNNIYLQQEIKRGDLEYYRVEIGVTKEGSSLDDATPKNIQYLKQVGLETANRNPVFGQIIDRLGSLKQNQLTMREALQVR